MIKEPHWPASTRPTSFEALNTFELATGMKCDSGRSMTLDLAMHANHDKIKDKPPSHLSEKDRKKNTTIFMNRG